MKKNFLIVGDFIAGSGLTEFIFNVFRNLSTNLYNITAVGYGEDRSKEVVKKCRKLNWNLIRVIPVTKNPLEHWNWWKIFLQKNNFDYLYFNYSSSWNYKPVQYAHKYQSGKIIIHSHSTYYSHKFNSKILMLLLDTINRHGKKVFISDSNIKIATSNEAAKWMFNDIKNVYIVNNGINVKQFKFDNKAREKIRKKYKISPTEVVVGFVGVLQPKKNPFYVLKIFKEYNLLNRNSVLVIIGRGYLKKEMISRIKEYNLGNKVIFINYTSKVNKWYSAMDVLIFPSKHEGFGLVPLEAQVSNLLVIASDRLPEAVFVSNCIEKKSIDIDPKKWALDIQKNLSLHTRRNTFNVLFNKYDSIVQFKKIEKILSDE